MDLNEFLETIVEFDENNPYGIIISQLVFDSFRKYCIDFIQDSSIEMFESLYDLVKKYTDDSFKNEIDEIFQAERFEQFSTQDLCFEFFKKIIEFLKKIDESIEDKITDFLDYNIYKTFEIVLEDNKEYYFFPHDYEDDLHYDVYIALKEKLNKKEKEELKSEILNTPIDDIKKVPVKSLTHAIVKNKHRTTRKKLSFKSSIAFAKTKKHHK